MSENRYVVLRSREIVVPSMENLGTRGVGGVEVAMPPEIEIEEVALSKSERDDLRRDPRTRAIATAMPMSLIKPVSASGAVAMPSSAVAWGVQAVGATVSPFDGGGITVAVLDTGIDPNHPAFAGVSLVRRNFTTEGDDDGHGHGTHCAGTIFGRDVDAGRIGVARGVERALIGKVLGEGGGTSATLAQAIQWAVDEGAHVVSMSLGIDFPGFVDYLVNVEGLDVNPATSLALEAYRANVNLFTELSRFIDARGLFEQGTIVVAASGNESERPNYEIAVAPPAAGTGIVAVGALGEGAGGLSVAYFSNTQVDLSAPGVDVISAAPGGGLASMSGTSMATPHVAGVAALWAKRQLDRTGRVDGRTLMAQVVASGARTPPLVPGSEAEDVGTGIVQAPLN
ncbi:MAG: S8 family serine peptidase [Pseudomonadota bacterium]|nr:S8 family serine peptidase [Pseudomonadota bacterium]